MSSSGTLTDIFEQRDELSLDNMALARLTKKVDPRGRGIAYQTIRRIEQGENIPRERTILILREALKLAEKDPKAALADA